MGRSKFPGKPSKHNNRKRVNVLPPISDNQTKCNNKSLTVETVGENNKQDGEKVEKSEKKDDSGHSMENDENTKVSLRRRLNRKLQNSNKNLRNTGNNSTKRCLIPKICSNKLNGKTNITRKTSVRAYNNIKNIAKCRNNTQKETSNIVGKFVLPTRSVHSSRVIKPNKRFINVDLSDSLALKKKVINNKRLCVTQNNEDERKTEENKASDEGTSNNKTFINGRIVLRQARLKLHTQTPVGPKGPFSCNTTTTIAATTISNGSGTVTCGVCGAVRFYRFVKQARKFNIYSCESCRKFISKMIKRQTCGKNIGGNNSALVCHKGQGMCHVPPIVRSQQMKLIRCAYRARCPACWLKMCLRSFQMPLTLKNNLIKLLPKNMQATDVLFSNSLPLLWQSNTNIPQQNDNKDTIKQRPVRFKHNNKTVSNPQPVNSDIKRQKVDLKGPRVKHVCRSASIVLGQPLATFPNNEIDKKKINEQKEQIDIIINKKIDDKTGNNSNDTKNEFSFSENELSSDSDKLKLPSLNDTIMSSIKCDRLQKIPIYSNEGKIEKKQNIVEQQQNTVLIDFWENYDIDDISQNGFCLMGSKKFPMPSICFLCGSAGRDSLLYCSLCCEPYHPFCLEQVPLLNSYKNNRQFIWLCPKCTVCTACNLTDRQKIHCQKCSKTYHPECFNPKWTNGNKPALCYTCSTCKSCGKEIVKFIGNSRLCYNCFVIKKQLNMCAICNNSITENDIDKIMECTKCNKWIHGKCENLTEEYYQILILHPDTIRYLCKLCINGSTMNYWRKVIESELQYNLRQIMRLLSKNKTAKNMLKLSPFNNNNNNNNNNSTSLLNKTITNVKKIQFTDDNDDNNNSNDQNDDNNNNNDDNNSETTDIVDNDFNKNIIDYNLKFDIDNNRVQLFNNKNDTNENNNLLMLNIKNKLNSNEYISVREFNKDMEEAIDNANSNDLKTIYHAIINSVFPWYLNISNIDDSNDNSLKETLNRNDLSLSIYDDLISTQIEHDIIDTRYCSFCKGIGDGLKYNESRLLYCGQNEWVHINCAIWSSEVYEEIDGSLQNVHNALSRGRLIKCTYCKQRGATIGCCFKCCYETYHFNCARLARCYFMYDKTIYCFNHDNIPKNNIIKFQKDFDIRRSVFIELDKRKGKYSQIDKVNIMIGSLSVTNLGKINPIVSDNVDNIIPIGYLCSRLYWSTIEPWKLVSYNISTSILNSQVNTLYVDKNFTVDHTLPKSMVDKKLKEILIWQKDIDSKKKTDVLIEYDDDEEPQNASADLLSPEITDAIFEELPRELLDGISVQDIIMSYEDFINVDNNELLKKNDIEDDNSLMEFDMKETTKSKNQRSCSLTLSCKLDNTFSPAIKKRKITPRDNNLFFQLLQVDGNFDDSSSSDCDSPTGVDQLTTNLWNATTITINEEPVTCERCHCTYRTQASYKRHLDTCEIICTSESDSELNQEQDTIISQTAITNTNVMKSTQSTVVMDINEQETPQPIVLTSYESYQNEIHTSVLNTQTFLTSDSVPVPVSVPVTVPVSVPVNDNIILSNIPQHVEQKQPLINSTQYTNLPINTVAPLNQQQSNIMHNTTNNETIRGNQTTQFCLNQTVPLCVNPPLALQQNSIVNPTTILNQIQPTNGTTTMEYHQPTPVTIQSVPYSNNLSSLINVQPQQNNQIQFNNNKMINSNIINPVVTQNGINIPTTNTWIKPAINKTIMSGPKNVKTRGRGRTIAAKRNNNNNSITHFDDNDTIIIPNTTTTSTTAPSVIVQHLPSTSFIPTFVDTFQQPSGQNLQYLTTIPSQSLVQLQDNNLISILPGIQPTMIIQQQQPTTTTRLLENQFLLDSNGSLTWAPQPIYYGFETIVQNTVMQSQQFLPTTMAGVLTTNSSYSTTTQVFQTSKLEPVIDVVTPNSFLLLNSSQLVNPSQSIHLSHNQTSPQQPQQLNNSNVVQITQASSELKSECHTTKSTYEKTNTIQSTSNTNSIQLPIAPFVSEQRIPTNIVTPTPKLPTLQQSRPMSRVLPMQTLKETKIRLNTDKTDIICNNKDYKVDFNEKNIKILNPINKTTTIAATTAAEAAAVAAVAAVAAAAATTTTTTTTTKTKTNKINETIMDFEIFPTTNNVEKTVNRLDTNNCQNDTSLKLIFQKQSQDGTYKISNNFNEKNQINEENFDKINFNHKNNQMQINNQDTNYKLSNNFNYKTSSVQVAPLKPIKSNYLPSQPIQILPLTDKHVNKQNDKYLEKKSTLPFQPVSLPLPTQPPPPLLPSSLSTSQLPSFKHHNNDKKENENIPQILYTIETQDGFKYTSTSISDLWTKVFEAVQNARIAHNMPPLPSDSTNVMNNMQVLGLKRQGLKYLIEQLPGASKCVKYKPTFNFPSLSNEFDDEPVLGHLNGCARCVPNIKRNEPYDMFGWLASKHRKPEHLMCSDLVPRRGSVNNLPMAMRFRQLKLTSKFSVGVYRSKIHRRGLFCLRDFEAGEMVIEYSGEVIRSILTDKREKFYNSKGIGCYMFRIDDNLVVDATMTGNAARFINHSCDPNCYSKVVEILGHKHIIIFALRRIICGEELTYDYKFPIEEDKIPCTCGTRRCRKFLN